MTSNGTANVSGGTDPNLAYYVGIYTNLHNSYLWVLAILGIPGNIGCLLTVTTMSVTTATVYVTLLAATDLLALVMKLIFHQLGIYHVQLYDVGCKFSLFVEVISCFANWTLVLICFERFLAVCFPLLRNAYFTRKKAVGIAVLMGVVIFLIYLYAIVLRDWTGQWCEFQPQPATFSLYWNWVTATVYSFLPFVFLAVSTFFIIQSLKKHFRVRRNLQAASREGMRDESGFSHAERAICVMMVSAAIVFLLLTLPSCLYFILEEAKVLDLSSPTIRERFQILVFRELGFGLADANHAVNFYIYFLTNSRFRAQFKAVLQKCCKKTPNGTIRSDCGTAATTVQRSLEHLNATKI